MKKTHVYEVFANVRATFVSFFSIAMFVALGVAVYLGLHWGAQSLSGAIEDAFVQANFHDIAISVPSVLTDEQIEAMSTVEGVELLESGSVTYGMFQLGDGQARAKVQTIPATLDQPIVREGALPKGTDQVAVMDHWAANNDVKVGDTIAFEKDGNSGLGGKTLTVCGLVRSPAYLSRNTNTYGITGADAVDCVMFVADEALDDSTPLNTTTSLYVRVAGTEGLSPFSAEYRERVKPVTKRLSDLTGTYLTEQLQVLYDIFDKIKDVLTSAVDDAELGKYLTKEERKILKDISQSLQDLASRKFTLMGQTIRASEMPQKIDNLRQLFQKGGAQAFVTDRAHNGGIMFAQTLIDILERLRYTMAVLFVVVGLLVCYSAMSRMVNEQVVQVGTKKALGLFVREVTVGYLAYAAVAVLLGLVLGAAGAYLAVEAILNPPLANCFVLGLYPRHFAIPDTLLVGGIELVLILAATWLSCSRLLRRRTVDLLAGTKPPTAHQHFFESWKVWQRLPVLGKTVVNNCINDKRRVLSTLLGVSGCTALVVCALTLNNNVLDSYGRQYRDVYSFDAIASLDTSVKGAQKKVAKELDARSMPHAPVLKRTVVLNAMSDDGTGSMPARLLVPTDADKFAERYHVSSLTGGDVDLNQYGVWVAAGFGQTSQIKVGDPVRIIDTVGEIHELPVLGYYAHHLIMPDILMGTKTYKKAYSVKPTANALLVDTGATDPDELGGQLAGTKGFGGIANDKRSSRAAFDQFAKLSRTVVLVYVGLSALMAIVVLLNLDLMFIQEKKRELIVLMVCGYSARSAKGYVAYDTAFLTIVGILLGIALGTATGTLTVLSVEPSNVMFLHDINPAACLLGAAISGLFALVMGLVALRRIPRFDLTDISRF